MGKPLEGEEVVYLYLDATGVKTRVRGRVVSRAILLAVRIREDGQKMLLGLWSKGSESREAWMGVLGDRVARGLRRPLGVDLDGCPGLRAAVEEVWAGIEVQPCAVHKLWNRAAPRGIPPAREDAKLASE